MTDTPATTLETPWWPIDRCVKNALAALIAGATMLSPLSAEADARQVLVVIVPPARQPSPHLRSSHPSMRCNGLRPCRWGLHQGVDLLRLAATQILTSAPWRDLRMWGDLALLYRERPGRGPSADSTKSTGGIHRVAGYTVRPWSDAGVCRSTCPAVARRARLDPPVSPGAGQPTPSPRQS